MKFLKLTFLFLFVFAFAMPSAFAQKGERKLKRQERRKQKKERKADHIKYSTQQLGAAYGTFQDLGLSNQVYQGSGLNLILGNFKETPKSLREFNFLGGV